jgi:formate C-acetyltransferase
VWHGRYLALLKEKIKTAADDGELQYYTELYENLAPVPFNPPVNYRQAMQALWFLFAFTRLCGNWSGLGRIDVMVGAFLERDLMSGKITENEAREIMAHFFIKGCEWIRLDSRGTGDAQHYQNIVLAGCDEDGSEIACTATRLALEVVEEFPISDYPIAVRINEDSPDWLIRKIAEVMRHGSGVAAVYNERLIIGSLTEFGYNITEARRFANDGCWEVQVPGKTLFSYHPMDALELLQRHVLGLYDDLVRDYDSFDDIVKKYDEILAAHMEEWHRGADSFAKGGGPSSVMALFEDDCIENACDYYCGGTRYAALSPHLGGIPDAANEMYAIKKLVYEEKKLTFPAFMAVLKNNWDGNEELRQYVRRSYVYYGNDNDEVDSILAHIMDTFMDETRRVKFRSGVLRPAGISTFGRQIDWKDSRRAHAHGFRIGDILASNLSPTPGTDTLGATAVILSHCKTDFSRLTCGTALDIKLDPTSVSGDDGIEAIMSLIHGFITLGGFFIQIDVMDNAVLLEAQRHPEDYQNLSVRISGWSARFDTLCDDWQRMIIERTAMGR